MMRRLLSPLCRAKARDECSEILAVEVLEDRTLLSFIGHVNGDTLYVTQTVAEGNVVFDDNGPSGEFRVTDLSGTLTFDPATNVSIVMRDSQPYPFSTTIDMDSPFLGDFRISRNAAGVHFTGDANTFGSLVVGMGAADQHINLAVNADLTVLRSMVIGAGRGKDQLNTNGRTINIGERLVLDRLNRFVNDGTFIVGESVSWEFYDEAQSNYFRNGGVMQIGGKLTINRFENNSRDQLDRYNLINMSVGGDTYVNLGENSANMYQHVDLSGFTSGRNTTVFGGYGRDAVKSDANTTVDGNVLIDLGYGVNEANLAGTHDGQRVTYRGGGLNDMVYYSMSGSPDVVNFILGEGNDWVEVSGNVSPTLFRTDFGGGNDRLMEWSPDVFDFQANFLNWNGFNHFYHDGKVAEIQEDGIAGNIRFEYTGGQMHLHSSSGTSAMPNVSAVVTYMRNNTQGNIEVDIDEVLNLDTFGIQMGHGQRHLAFNGSNNTFNGDLIIDGVLGDQTLYLDENQALTVTGKMIVDLKTGNDSIMPILNGVSVGQNLTLRGVNHVFNKSLFEVDGNFLFSSATEFPTQATILQSTAWLSVGGWFNYHGGHGVDTIRMTGEESFTGNVFVDLNFGINGGAPQVVDFSGSEFLGDLRVRGSDSEGGNRFITDDFTSIANNVMVHFTGPGPHLAVFRGHYGGTYGTYRGGPDSDRVTFAASASNMTFFTRMGDGDDLFHLLNESDLAKLIIDFGPGNDQFDDQIGKPYPFPVVLKNYP